MKEIGPALWIALDGSVHFRYTYRMSTKLIGVKEFRANISKYAQKARKGDVRYVVMHRNSPLFEVKPFEENEGLEAIFADIIAAEEDVKKGQLYTQEEIMAEFA